MQPFQSRVIREKKELGEKIAKLKEFVDGPRIDDIPEDERLLLRRQLAVMQEYFDILSSRITAFGPLGFNVFVNGKSVAVNSEKLTYEDVVRFAHYPHGSMPTVTCSYIGDRNSGRILIKGDSIELVGNEYFNVVFTGNA